jgi:hypothetical protein
VGCEALQQGAEFVAASVRRGSTESLSRPR